jgi:hypothetical protein
LWNPAVAAPSWLQGNRRGKFSDDPRSTFFFAERECIDDIAVRVEELTGAAGDVTLASMDVPRSRAKPRPDAEDPGQPF